VASDLKPVDHFQYQAWSDEFIRHSCYFQSDFWNITSSHPVVAHTNFLIKIDVPIFPDTKNYRS
jgi:hypothetical protein